MLVLSEAKLGYSREFDICLICLHLKRECLINVCIYMCVCVHVCVCGGSEGGFIQGLGLNCPITVPIKQQGYGLWLHLNEACVLGCFWACDIWQYLLQRSIEDKLNQLNADVHSIADEIARITPELVEVIFCLFVSLLSISISCSSTTNDI